jgi:hypothetical protein
MQAQEFAQGKASKRNDFEPKINEIPTRICLQFSSLYAMLNYVFSISYKDSGGPQRRVAKGSDSVNPTPICLGVAQTHAKLG